MRPIEDALGKLRELGKRPRRVGVNRWLALCPAHDDTRPSLSVGRGHDGTLLLKCFAGCRFEDILDALGLREKGRVQGRSGPRTATPRIVAEYDYRDERGEVLYQVARLEPKDFRCRRPNGSGGWTWSMNGQRRVLYRLPEALEAVRSARRLYIVEGEKDADALAQLGLAATTNMHGAGKWRDEYSRSLVGVRAVIVPDNDPQGRAHARQVARSLAPYAAEVRILELPGLLPKQDVSDWLANGGARSELERLAGEAPLCEPAQERAQTTQPLESSNLNDLHHARQIARRFGHSIRHCERQGGFFVYDGARWIRDETGQVWRWAVETAEDIQREARELSNEDERRRLLEWAVRAERRANIESALKQLAALEGIAVTHDAFDRDPWLFNCANGTVDLRSGKLRPHRREDMLSKISPVAFDPEARCPQWQAFLKRITDDNVDVLAFLQRAVGYALSGSVREQKLLFLHGAGANGKSTFLNMLLHVWGDYARRIAPDLLFLNRDDRHPTALADLCGVRLAVTTEIEQGKRLAEVLVKELSGGDRLLARRMRQDYFEFEPTHTLFIAGNHLPVIRGSEHAVWRRIALVPFTVTVPENEQDKDLADKLRAEAAGILRWCVRGCLDWQAFGLSEPADVRAATSQYRSDMDILGDFLGECCVVVPGAEVTSAELNKAYRAWCEKTGERAMSARSLGLRLKERGFTQKLTGNSRSRTWIGIGLLSER
ncbi:MAG: hypothetical protein Kow0099_06130 [Candidatus Abyssubacteria bacterium]